MQSNYSDFNDKSLAPILMKTQFNHLWWILMEEETTNLMFHQGIQMQL